MQAFKGREHGLVILLCDADAVIPHGNFPMPRNVACGFDLDFDRRIRLAVFDRVCEQAAQHLLEVLEIGANYGQRGAQADARSGF